MAAKSKLRILTVWLTMESGSVSSRIPAAAVPAVRLCSSEDTSIRWAWDGWPRWTNTDRVEALEAEWVEWANTHKVFPLEDKSWTERINFYKAKNPDQRGE